MVKSRWPREVELAAMMESVISERSMATSKKVGVKMIEVEVCLSKENASDCGARLNRSVVRSDDRKFACGGAFIPLIRFPPMHFRNRWRRQ